MPDNIVVAFQPSGRGKAQCPPNPEYPDGVHISPAGYRATKPWTDLECIGHGITCLVELPYPAPECGMWMIHCLECDIMVAVTAAGRPDDPRSVRIPCALPQASAEGDGMAKASTTDAETPGEHAESPSSKEKGSDG